MEMMKKNVNFANLTYAKNVVNPTLYGIYEYYLYVKSAVNEKQKEGETLFLLYIKKIEMKS
tara:strand:+ start:941 stop:1123 length:183 start_codon:yes stop_codon:yes gene_type:complete